MYLSSKCCSQNFACSPKSRRILMVDTKAKGDHFFCDLLPLVFYHFLFCRITRIRFLGHWAWSICKETNLFRCIDAYKLWINGKFFLWAVYSNCTVTCGLWQKYKGTALPFSSSFFLAGAQQQSPSSLVLQSNLNLIMCGSICFGVAAAGGGDEDLEQPARKKDYIFLMQAHPVLHQVG